MRKIDFSDLIESGQLRHEPDIGKDQVVKLLKRALMDIDALDEIIEIDEAIAMQVSYDAMFHAANALLRLYGYRPGPIRQHQGVIAAVGRIIGEKADFFTKRFDRLRRRRNEFEYQGSYEMGYEELKDALINAKQFVLLIKDEIQRT